MIIFAPRYHYDFKASFAAVEDKFKKDFCNKKIKKQNRISLSYTQQQTDKRLLQMTIDMCKSFGTPGTLFASLG